MALVCGLYHQLLAAVNTTDNSKGQLTNRDLFDRNVILPLNFLHPPFCVCRFMYSVWRKSPIKILHHMVKENVCCLAPEHKHIVIPPSPRTAAYGKHAFSGGQFIDMLVHFGYINLVEEQTILPDLENNIIVFAS